MPKNFYFPTGLPFANTLNKYDGEAYSQTNTYEPTEPSTKNSSFLKPKAKPTTNPSKPKAETAKTEKIIKEKEKVEIHS